MRKRILALLLALVMCLSLLPTAAFAEDVTDTDDTTSAPTIDDAVGGSGVDDSDDETTDTNDTTDTTDTSDTTDTTDTTDDEDAPVPVVQSAAPLLGAASTPVVLASTGTHTNHKSCGSASCTGGGHDCSATTWDAWTETNSLPTGGGSYYLTGNVTISSTWKPSSTAYQKTTTNLCLNGYTITYTGTTESPAIEIQGGGKKLVLCDCKNTGKIVHNGSKGGSAVQVKGSFTMYGSTITRGDNAGSGVKVMSGGYFTMYGGTITGHRSSGSITGSGVYVASSGSFTLSGGKITDNRGTYNGSNTYGGGVFVAAYPYYGNFSMSGGTIGGTGEDDGNSADYGGGVYIENNTQDAPNVFHMIMSGGTITGNSADQGGGVLVDLYGFFKMTGGTITQNVAEENGGGVYVKSDTITVGGGATITGNKKVGLGTASGGKENNVYLPSESVYITVNSGFTGAVGLNVDGEHWGTTPPGGATNFGANWVTVKGDGSSDAVKNNKVTYDDSDFEIENTSKNIGKLKCLHACGIESSTEYPYVCERCGEWIIIKTEFKNAAGNTLKTQYYADAATAFDKAEDNCVITMLTAAEFKSYTWTLDGKTVTLYADYTLEGLTVEGGTLNLRYTRDITIPYIHSMVVGAGATVNVDVYPSGFTDSSSLTVKSGGKVVFESGHVDNLIVNDGGTMEISGVIVKNSPYPDKLKSTFDSIHVENGTCADLLKSGYAFFDQTNQTIVKGNTKNLTNVTVNKHASCDFTSATNGVCGCGRECPHSSIGFATGKCTTCNEPLDGILVQKTAGGTTVTGKFATFNAAMDSIKSGDTNVTIKLMEDAAFEDTDPAAEDDNTTILSPCTLDLNGKKLTVKEKSGDHTEESNLIIASTVAITDTSTGPAGTIDSGVSVYAGEDVVGSLTVTGNVSIPRLWVNNGAVAKLKGGTYDKITVPDGKTCSDLLAPGYAYFKNGKSVSGNVTALSGVTVGKHTSCTFNEANHGICACGRECPHGEINASTHKCSVCKTQMVAMVTKGTAGSTFLYYTTFNAALEGVRDAKSTDNATLTLLADTTLSADATLPGGKYTIELNGKKLGNSTGKTYVLTADGSGVATIQDSSTGKTGRIGCTLRCIAAGSNSPNIMSGTFARLELDMAGKTGTGWPHLFGGTFEKLVRADSGTTSRTIRVISMLAPGCALKKTTSDTAFVAATTEITATAIENVTVVTCTCGNSPSCKNCGKDSPVELTLYDENDAVVGYYTRLSDATTANKEAENNTSITVTRATIRLLSVTPEDITCTNSIPLILDLNGQNLNGTITVNTTSSLTITGDGKVDGAMNKAVVVTNGTVYIENGTFIGGLEVKEGGNAKLSGGTFGLRGGSSMPDAEIKVASGNVGGLLAEGYGYWCDRGTSGSSWATTEQLNQTTLSRDTTQGASAITVKALPGVSVTPATISVTYGSPATLTAAVSDVTDGAAVSYQWYTVSGTTEAKIHDATNASYKTPENLAIGPHTFICKATVYGYTLTGNQVTVTVTKATLTEQTGTTGSSGSGGESGSGSTSTATYTAPKAKTGLTYTGEAQALMIDAGAVPTGCTMKYSLDKNTWTDNAEDIKETNASSYTVYWYIDGGTNYSDVGSETAPQLLTVTIARKTIGSGDITVTGGGYTGKPIEPTITVKVGDVTLKAGTDYTVSGATKKTDAGTYDLTITGKGNYAGTPTVKWTITRKTLTLTPNTYIVYAKKGAAPTADLAQIAKMLGMPADDGALTFYGSDEQPISALPAADATTTLTLSVRSKNQQAAIQIEIVVSDKIVPAVSVSDYNKPYSGAEVTVDDVAKSVTDDIEGAWSWTNGTAPKNVADSGYYSLTFTPTDDDYSAVTATVQVTITRKTVTLSNLAAQKVYDGTAAVNENTALSLSFSDSLVLGTDYTITASFDNANAGTGKTVTATVTLSDSAAENYCFAGSGGTSVKKVTITGTNGVIAQKELTIGSASANPKYYDGTVTVSGYSVALEGFVEDESGRPKRGTDYTLAASFDSADVGMDKTVTITVTLADTAKAANYCFMVNGSASRTITKTVEADIYRLPLDTLPTAKESVVKLQQDVSVRSGSYPLSGNVNVVLPEGVTLDLSRELRFALGTLPAKVTASIDENGLLTYTITGGRSGEKFAIPVTVTMPNLAYYAGQGGGAAAVALYAQNESDGQTPEIDPDAGTITLTFTVEIELTGSAAVHHPNRWNGNLTGGTVGGSGSGSTSGTGAGSGNGTGSGSGVASPATGDAGIALYGVLAVLSMTGGAWIRRKKR